MSDINDLTRGPTGPRGRPQHPDMIRLLDLALQLDGQASEGGQNVDDIASEVVDTESIIYLAMQRLIRASDVTGIRVPFHVRAMAAGMFLEGFILGTRWAVRDDE